MAQLDPPLLGQVVEDLPPTRDAEPTPHDKLLQNAVKMAHDEIGKTMLAGLREIRQARNAVLDAEATLVHKARGAGCGWVEIAEAMGFQPIEVQQWYER